MAYTVTASFSEEQAKVEGTRPVSMYILNASYSGIDHYYYIEGNQDTYGFILNASGNLGATEQVYTALPVLSEGDKSNIEGETADVSFSIPNVDRTVESLIQGRNYLRGCRVYKVSGFGTYLPSGATAYHIGSSEDKNSFIVERYYVDSTSSDENAVTFSCKPKFVLRNAVLPRRSYNRECAWAYNNDYLGSFCDPLASVNSASYPTCDGSLENCRQRHNVKRYGGFPSVPQNAIYIV